MSARVWCHCTDCDLVFSRGPSCTLSPDNLGHHTRALEVCTGCLGRNLPARHAAWCPVREEYEAARARAASTSCTCFEQGAMGCVCGRS